MEEKDRLLNEGFHKQQGAAKYSINSRAQLEGLLKHSKDHKKSVTKSPCKSCKQGWHYKIRNNWTKCNLCGYRGYKLP